MSCVYNLEKTDEIWRPDLNFAGHRNRDLYNLQTQNCPGETKSNGTLRRNIPNIRVHLHADKQEQMKGAL
jgi:hypothetical protein